MIKNTIESKIRLTQQQQFDILGHLNAILLQVLLDQLRSGNGSSFLGRWCTTHGEWWLSSRRIRYGMMKVKVFCILVLSATKPMTRGVGVGRPKFVSDFSFAVKCSASDLLNAWFLLTRTFFVKYILYLYYLFIILPPPFNYPI